MSNLNRLTQVDETLENEQNEETNLNPFIIAGIGTFFILNVGVLLSLPPVLMGRGAPYLPTFNKSLDAMFQQLKNDTEFQKRIAIRTLSKRRTLQQLSVPTESSQNIYQSSSSSQKPICVSSSSSLSTTSTSLQEHFMSSIAQNQSNINTEKNENNQCDLLGHNTNNDKKLNNELIFIDLGSGDGRLVFRAAQEGIFDQCIGYEINPVLHILATIQRVLGGPKYWNGKTQFYIRNLWDVKLHNADVVAVYGLGPIMKELGAKLENELKPGSIVLSNVFAIPNWNSVSASGNTYMYRISKINNSKVNDS